MITQKEMSEWIGRPIFWPTSEYQVSMRFREKKEKKKTFFWQGGESLNCSSYFLCLWYGSVFHGMVIRTITYNSNTKA